MRRGVHIKQKLSNANKLLKNLSLGSVVDPRQIEIMHQQITDLQNQKYLDDIQRKHLMGLLSHEEAKISKMTLHQMRKFNANEIKQMKLHWMQHIRKWKMDEMKKLHQMVERNLDVVQLAREAKMRCIARKQKEGELR